MFGLSSWSVVLWGERHHSIAWSCIGLLTNLHSIANFVGVLDCGVALSCNANVCSSAKSPAVLHAPTFLPGLRYSTYWLEHCCKQYADHFCSWYSGEVTLPENFMVSSSADPPPFFWTPLVCLLLPTPTALNEKLKACVITHRVCYCVMHTAGVTTPCVITLTVCIGLSPLLTHYWDYIGGLACLSTGVTCKMATHALL